MRKLQPYVPQPKDIAWAQQVIALVIDGGFVCTTPATYKLDKINKRFILVAPSDVWDNPMTACLHHRHHYVWAEIGWTVEPVLDWDALEVPDTTEMRTQKRI